MKNLSYLVWWVVGLLSFLVGGWITWLLLSRYAINHEWSYLEAVKQFGSKNWFRAGFYLHITGAIPILFIGWFQFSKILREKFTILHRTFGKIYIFLLLFAAAPGGFILGIGAAGGWPGKVCFLLMCPIWAYFTWDAYHKIRQGNVEAHRHAMIRSYAMSFGAITLRIWMFVIGGLLEYRTPGAYALCAWLSWVPNLILAELYIRSIRTITGYSGG